MRFLNLIIILLMIEALLILLIFCLIMLHRFFSILIAKKKQAVRKKVSAFLMRCVNNQTVELPFPKECYNFEQLVIEMEIFDLKVKGDFWKEIKNHLMLLYLLKKARKYSKSIFWRKRHLSARCFALAPRHSEENRIVNFLFDPVFLVRAGGALAVIRLESYEATCALIKKMGEVSGYEWFFYKDLFLNAKGKIFDWIREIGSKDFPLSVHATILEILESEIAPLPFKTINKFLSSKDLRKKILALRFLAKNPLKESEEEIMKSLESSIIEEKILAIDCLKHFPTKKNLLLLEKFLQDSSVQIRMQAGKSLEFIKPEGYGILENQKKSLNKDVQEVVQYVLSFS